ncbi:hypothetical protein N0V90_005079 [Kalmusia sp. IMI 367209]|nr:hypothetical protein N0V90_005079 [Kalmusia sp. IMI 367209]
MEDSSRGDLRDNESTPSARPSKTPLPLPRGELPVQAPPQLPAMIPPTSNAPFAAKLEALRAMRLSGQLRGPPVQQLQEPQPTGNTQPLATSAHHASFENASTGSHQGPRYPDGEESAEGSSTHGLPGALPALRQKNQVRKRIARPTQTASLNIPKGTTASTRDKAQGASRQDTRNGTSSRGRVFKSIESLLQDMNGARIPLYVVGVPHEAAIEYDPAAGRTQEEQYGQGASRMGADNPLFTPFSPMSSRTQSPMTGLHQRNMPAVPPQSTAQPVMSRTPRPQPGNHVPTPAASPFSPLTGVHAMGCRNIPKNTKAKSKVQAQGGMKGGSTALFASAPASNDPPSRSAHQSSRPEPGANIGIVGRPQPAPEHGQSFRGSGPTPKARQSRAYLPSQFTPINKVMPVDALEDDNDGGVDGGASQH